MLLLRPVCAPAAALH
uniref:Uncharacterized protein n=1 Tax=Arundo donax TaxID=35708 RepID=A0A0A9AEZ5_ARUDO